MHIDFEALFASSPNPYVVLDPSLVIVWMNDAYLRATMREREDILGRSMFEAFPSDPASESYQLLKSSLDRALETGEPDELALIRYDIRKPGGIMDTRYWSATNTPIRGETGDVAFILQHTVDVTELHSLRTLRDEMGIVQRAHALQARNRDLAEESEQLRRLFEQAPGFVAVLSGPNHVFQMANEAYRRLVGQRDLTGRAVAEALPEVVEQGFVDLLDRVHDTATAYVGRREKIFFRNEPSQEAEERFLDFLYQPIFTDGGQVSGVFVQGHDVTDHVEAEEHQKLLISELNHRVKNTLAIVQSLATQSFRDADDLASMRDAFAARLAALAMAHNLLTAGNWEAASLAEIIGSSVAATAGSDLNRVQISGPDVPLPPQAATSVAMVIHELSTNAIKYGALLVPAGRVDVTWDISDADGERQITLEWAESGGPPVAPPARRGFGTRLIERGIASKRKAEVTLDFRPAGLRCRITAYPFLD